MSRVQMQGRNTVTQELVTWLADSIDWAGEQSPVPVADVALYVRAPASAFVPVVPIICAITAPLATDILVEDVAYLIAGTITRPGTVVISGLGAATVVGLTWSMLWTPESGDVGSRALTATATDASNGTTSSASVTFTVDAALAFPAGVSPAVWHDGREQAWADAGATIEADAPAGIVQRIDEAAPLVGSWTAPTAAERPFRDAASIRYETIGSAGGYQLTRPSVVGVAGNSCTLMVAFVARDNHFAGPVMGLFRDATARVGIRLASDTLWIYYGGANFFTNSATPAMRIAPGKLNVITVVYTPTSIDVQLDADGTVTTASLSVSLPATAVSGAWIVGCDGASYLYGSVSHAFAVASQLTIGGADQVAAKAWLKAQPVPDAYPLDRVLIAFVGDSITRMTSASYGKGYPFLSLASVRTAGYPAEVCDTAVGGTGVTGLLAPTSDNQSLFLRASAFYSAARLDNVMVIALGTNDMASANSVAYILHGTGAASGSGLYPAIDAAVAQGWKVVVVTPGPRTDTMGISQATHDAKRDAVCSDLVANAPAHGVLAVVDTRLIANYGAPTDSNNTTYYSADKVHPINAGHALLHPPVAAAIIAALAA